MSEKQKPDVAAAPKAEQAPKPEPKVDHLLLCLTDWFKQFSARDAAKRLRAALAAEGIDTTDALARASITTVANVLRAEFRLDAQALTAAAAQYKEQTENG